MFCEMITVLSFFNIHHYTELQSFFFLVMRSFKIYSLSNFQTDKTVLTIATMLYPTRFISSVSVVRDWRCRARWLENLCSRKPSWGYCIPPPPLL